MNDRSFFEAERMIEAWYKERVREGDDYVKGNFDKIDYIGLGGSKLDLHVFELTFENVIIVKVDVSNNLIDDGNCVRFVSYEEEEEEDLEYSLDRAAAIWEK